MRTMKLFKAEELEVDTTTTISSNSLSTDGVTKRRWVLFIVRGKLIDPKGEEDPSASLKKIQFILPYDKLKELATELDKLCQ